MYIASKFEEIFPPEIADFTYITDDTYTKAQIVQMERLILKILDFNLGAPTTHTFLLRYLKANEVDLLPSSGVPSSYVSSGKANSDSQAISQTISYLSMVPKLMFFNKKCDHNNLCFFFQYLSELALQDADPYLKYYPSVIAASAVCLSRHTLGQTAWVSTCVCIHSLSEEYYAFIPLISFSREFWSIVLGTVCLILATVCRICTEPWHLHRTMLNRPSGRSTALGRK